jgi:hypothetical protein
MNFSSNFSFRVKKSNYAPTLHLAGFGMDMAILNTHCEHAAATVANYLCPVIKTLSDMTALASCEKK